ncbi:hypothetical protein GUJ93_ZPchr0007g5788 [Zizania palustris]|uniref:RanBP2-type domain-containing protein n=1 Tax=Zizania palustris TaxID=103762 RepID=A0A8J5SUM0_ZIZPA|nr:hypothetical protein GUJ93_ZPchr0007g5788 [Zizania palustris]
MASSRVWSLTLALTDSGKFGAFAQVENRGAFGSKRSRNDVSVREGDWTCHQCGNVNFSFRNVCNRGACGAPRPSPSLSPRMPAPVAGGYDRSHLFYVISTDFQIGMGPFVIVTGMGYGPGPELGRYSYGFRGSPMPVSSPWSGGALVEIMTALLHENVVEKQLQHEECGAPRPSPGANAGPSRKEKDAPEGSWTCTSCNNLNYPFRTSCNRKGCGSSKPPANN